MFDFLFKKKAQEGPSRIVNPEASNHFMDISFEKMPVTISSEGVVVASSNDVLLVREVGIRNYAPVYYLPKNSLVNAELSPCEKRTFCPLKGYASYYNLQLSERIVSESVWSYEELLSFDERLHVFEGRIAFERQFFDIA